MSLLPIHALAATAEWCESQWKIDSEPALYLNPPEFSGLLGTWQSHSQECAGTVAYEARMAFVYLLLNQVDNARNVIKPFEGKNSKYSYLIDFASIHSDAVEMENKETIKVDDVRKLESEYLAYVKKYPDFPDAFGMLGSYQMFLGEYDAAISSLEKAKSTDMSASMIYRNLAISYTAIGKYDDAIAAGDKAYELNEKITSDQYFVYAVAKADAGLGDYKSAQTALKLIAAKKPEVKATPEFQDAVEFVINEVNKKQAAKQ